MAIFLPIRPTKKKNPTKGENFQLICFSSDLDKDWITTISSATINSTITIPIPPQCNTTAAYFCGFQSIMSQMSLQGSFLCSLNSTFFSAATAHIRLAPFTINIQTSCLFRSARAAFCSIFQGFEHYVKSTN